MIPQRVGHKVRVVPSKVAIVHSYQINAFCILMEIIISHFILHPECRQCKTCQTDCQSDDTDDTFCTSTDSDMLFLNNGVS